jgi:transcription termination/antitermination protein NusG
LSRVTSPRFFTIKDMTEDLTEDLIDPTEEAPQAASPEISVKTAAKAAAEDLKWYSLRVISGKERSIKERIDREIAQQGWQNYVTQVVVPSEKVYKIRNGKKVIQERNILPGYILVEALPAKLKGDVVSAITNVQNVIHFLGKNEPIPMQIHEARRLLGIVDDSVTGTEQIVEPFIVGEAVKITDGAFAEFVGEIQEINNEKKKLKVVVKIFGRGTEVELGFLQVEKQQ